MQCAARLSVAALRSRGCATNLLARHRAPVRSQFTIVALTASLRHGGSVARRRGRPPKSPNKSADVTPSSSAAAATAAGGHARTLRATAATDDAADVDVEEEEEEPRWVREAADGAEDEHDGGAGFALAGGRTPALADPLDSLDDEEDSDGAGEGSRRRRGRSSGAEAAGGGDLPEDDEEDGDGEAGVGPTAPSAAAAAAETRTPDVESKYLADAQPELAAEYTAAGDRNSTPLKEVMVDSAARCWWVCAACGHAWRCAVFIRCFRKLGCPACEAARHPSLAVARPDLVPLWDAAHNDPFTRPESLPADSRKEAHWICGACRRSYTARVKDRVKDLAGCPTCAAARGAAAQRPSKASRAAPTPSGGGSAISSGAGPSDRAARLAEEESALLQEWHPLKNGDLRLEDLQATDTKTKLWWVCASCGHDWEATLAARLAPSRRTRGKVCPVCHGKGLPI